MKNNYSQLFKSRFAIIIKIVDYIHTVIKIVLLLSN